MHGGFFTLPALRLSQFTSTTIGFHIYFIQTYLGRFTIYLQSWGVQARLWVTAISEGLPPKWEPQDPRLWSLDSVFIYCQGWALGLRNGCWGPHDCLALLESLKEKLPTFIMSVIPPPSLSPVPKSLITLSATTSVYLRWTELHLTEKVHPQNCKEKWWRRTLWIKRDLKDISASPSMGTFFLKIMCVCTHTHSQECRWIQICSMLTVVAAGWVHGGPLHCFAHYGIYASNFP